MQKHIIIIGGGAAGFFMAVNLKRLSPDCRVTILEKGNKVLSKVRISGGGRCNVTHACPEESLLVKNYPRGEKALRGAFSRFSVTDTITWFGERGVKLHTEADGRMFPESNDSLTIVNCLLGEAKKYGVTVKLGTDVRKIRKDDGRFILEMGGGGTLEADGVVVAAGGNPQSTFYDWLRVLGHQVVEPVPSLFTFNIPVSPLTELMGVAVPDASVRITGLSLATSGPMLITHWGLSGPAVLRFSAWAARDLWERKYDFTVLISWIGAMKEETVRLKFSEVRARWNTRQIAVHPLFDLPRRLWEYLVKESGIAPDMKWADLPKKNSNKLIEKLLNDSYAVKGKTTFKEEFVTAGGISLSEVDFRTMESRLVPGLYFTGEVLDIDGITGGFNFQAAWTTGWIAANALAKDYPV